MRLLLSIVLRVLGRTIGGIHLFDEFLGLLLLEFASVEVLLLAILGIKETRLAQFKLRSTFFDRLVNWSTYQNFGILQFFPLSLDFLFQKVHFVQILSQNWSRMEVLERRAFKS